MPQVLSKCRRPSHVLTSSQPAHDRHWDKGRKCCCRKQFKRHGKMNKVKLIGAQSKTVHVRQEEEDWEQEIEDFSRRTMEEKEKELRNKPPYDAEDDLNVAMCELRLYSVPHAPRPHQQHYNPSTYHIPPVQWIPHTSCIETDQFADAEE